MCVPSASLDSGSDEGRIREVGVAEEASGGVHGLGECTGVCDTQGAV